MSTNVEFFGGHTFHVGATEFVSGYGASTVDRFCVLKTAEQLDFYLELCRSRSAATIVELGIAAGGSAALLALVAAPRKLVALELDPTPVAALQELIEREHLRDRVRPVYGVDQADRERVLEVVTTEVGDDPLDLVIDDASHRLAETTASFETLFPLLRPHGLYVIEDWNSAHLLADHVGAASKDGNDIASPLSPLIMELLLLRASSGQVVDEIVVGDLWATVQRGPAELDPRTFRVGQHYRDHFGLVTPAWHAS